MKTKQFLQQLDDDRIVAAIESAEQKTSGEIRVWISDRNVADPMHAARERFRKLAMDRTEARNGVLIYVAPRVQRFAVIGDEGVHARCGETFWRAVAAEMERCLEAQDFTGGIVRAVEEVGALLGEHFPRAIDDENELPNRIGRE